MLCGLLVPSEGSVTVAGRPVGEHDLEAKRTIGFVPDGAPLYPNLSAQQHLDLVGRLHGMDEILLASESRRLLACLGLAERAGDPVGDFSHGMRQKVAMACAILPRPALLVLDEPLSGLDAPTAATFKEVFRGWAEGGGAVLYTSHLLDVVERVCDRMAILNAGRLVDVGPLEDLRRRSGHAGTLEEVFGVLTRTEDPRESAARILGR
jgi:ABC-2 type transport system ATP-binding protein